MSRERAGRARVVRLPQFLRRRGRQRAICAAGESTERSPSIRSGTWVACEVHGHFLEMSTAGIFGLYWPPTHQRDVLAAAGQTLMNTVDEAYAPSLTTPFALANTL